MQAIRILAAAALVFVASTAAAQGGQGGPPGGQGGQGMQQRQNEMLFKDITLSEAQKARIDSIQTASRTKMQEMMQAGGMQDPANREKMMEMRRKQQADIRAVLTAEQQVQYDKNLAAMPQGRGQRPPDGR